MVSVGDDDILDWHIGYEIVIWLPAWRPPRPADRMPIPTGSERDARRRKDDP
jgi:hypothetical protein